MFKNVLKPYIDEQRKKYGGKQTKALVIFDYHKSNLHREVYDYMELENWCWKIVPEHCIDHCQPMDLSVNKMFKLYLRQQWTNWYGEQLMMQLKSGKDITKVKVDTTLTFLKPIHAQWVQTAFGKLKDNKTAMKKGWAMMGLNKSKKREHVEEKKE